MRNASTGSQMGKLPKNFFTYIHKLLSIRTHTNEPSDQSGHILYFVSTLILSLSFWNDKKVYKQKSVSRMLHGYPAVLQNWPGSTCAKIRKRAAKSFPYSSIIYRHWNTNDFNTQYCHIVANVFILCNIGRQSKTYNYNDTTINVTMHYNCKYTMQKKPVAVSDCTLMKSFLWLEENFFYYVHQWSIVSFAFFLRHLKSHIMKKYAVL